MDSAAPRSPQHSSCVYALRRPSRYTLIWLFMLTLRSASRPFLFGPLGLLLFCVLIAQPSGAQAPVRDADLQLVIVLTRHGVRAPMAQPELYQQILCSALARVGCRAGPPHSPRLPVDEALWRLGSRDSFPPMAFSLPPAAPTPNTSRSWPISTSALAKPAKRSPRGCSRIAILMFTRVPTARSTRSSARAKPASAIRMQHWPRQRSQGASAATPPA